MACGKNQDKGKMSEKQRAAISKGATGKKKTAEQKKKISDGMKNSECVKSKKKKKK
jgi:hypothetical protein